MSFTIDFRLARSVDFDSWSERHDIHVDERRWANPEFMGYVKNPTYPSFVNSAEALTMARTFLCDESGNDSTGSVEVFSAWRNKIKQTEPSDPYSLAQYFPILLNVWHNATKKGPKPPEAGIRGLVDHLLQIAFENRRGGRHRYLFEKTIPLPDPGPGDPQTIQTDGIAARDFPEDWFEAMKSACHYRQFYLNPSAPDDPTEPPAIVSFVFEVTKDCQEANENVAFNQLQMTFYAAHRHRKDIGMKPGPIFGAAQNGIAVKVFVSFYCSDSDRLVVQPVRRYVLCTFGEYLELYFIMCKISDYQVVWLDDEFRRWDESDRLMSETFENPPTKRRKHNPPSTQRGNQSGSNVVTRSGRGKNTRRGRTKTAIHPSQINTALRHSLSMPALTSVLGDKFNMRSPNCSSCHPTVLDDTDDEIQELGLRLAVMGSVTCTPL